jgi:hypothetical protein
LRQDSTDHVPPYSGELGECYGVIGNATSVFADHSPSGLVEIAGPAIITESFPKSKHLVFTCPGKVAHCRKGTHESLKIGNDRGYLGLLKHDFTDPDAIGIAIVSPRKLPAIADIPVEETAAKRCAKS